MLLSLKSRPKLQKFVTTMIVLVLAGFLVFFVYSLYISRLNSNQMSPDAIIKFMNQKYDTEFTFFERTGANIILGIPRVDIDVKCKEFPNDKIRACAEIDTEGKVIYRDNYVGYLLQDQTRSLLTNIVEKVYGSGCKMFYGVGSGPLSPFFNKQTTLEEYITSEYNSDMFNVVLQENKNVLDKDGDLNKLVKELTSRMMRFSFSICYISDDTIFSNMTKENFISYRTNPDEYKTWTAISINKNFEVNNYSWRMGTNE